MLRGGGATRLAEAANDDTLYEDASLSTNTKLFDATNRPENHTPEEKVPVVRELGRHTPGYKYLSGSVS
jgi:hypothetical protein